ncbi:hypothetical protein [Rhizobium sp. RSm-3]|uniref:hypothetical protein n=1 Tax=Rhizobium sp. RSm-3 TaxID=1720346 RepID=UPI001FCDD9A9|nr:hypothetical protein [Rhizobium sp. RSm-3]
MNFIIVFSVGVLLATAAGAAGFDCSKAGSADEKTSAVTASSPGSTSFSTNAMPLRKKQRPTRITSIRPAISWRIGAIAATTGRAF